MLKFIVLLMLIIRIVSAEEFTQVKSDAETSTQEKVWLGMYVNRIEEINLRDNYFIADFYIWFRWKNKELKPYESFGIVDADIENKGDVDLFELPDGLQYACLRVKAKVNKQWDIHKYPLDSHILSLKIEDENNEIDSILYLPDSKSSKISNNRFVNGYRLQNLTVKPVENKYYTNYGDTSLPSDVESVYSQLQFNILAQGGTISDIFKIYWGLFISVFVAWIAFLIKPINLDPRFGVSIGAIFAAAATGIMISDSLPISSDFVLADILSMLSLGYIFMITVISALVLKLYESGKEKEGKLIDTICLIMVPISYIVLVINFIIN